MTRARKPVDHGTNPGWSRHYADGDVDRWNAGTLARCEPCIAAHAAYNRAWRAKRTESRPRPRPSSFYRKRAAVIVPNHVLGLLLASAPAEVTDWATAHLSASVVERALWHAEHTDDLPADTTDRRAA